MRRSKPSEGEHVRIVRGPFMGREGVFTGNIVYPEYQIRMEPYDYKWFSRRYFLTSEEGYEPISLWRFFRQYVTSPHPLKEEHVIE